MNGSYYSFKNWSETNWVNQPCLINLWCTHFGDQNFYSFRPKLFVPFGKATVNIKGIDKQWFHQNYLPKKKKNDFIKIQIVRHNFSTVPLSSTYLFNNNNTMIVTLLRDNFGKLNAFYFDFFFYKRTHILEHP